MSGEVIGVARRLDHVVYRMTTSSFQSFQTGLDTTQPHRRPHAERAGRHPVNHVVEPPRNADHFARHLPVCTVVIFTGVCPMVCVSTNRTFFDTRKRAKLCFECVFMPCQCHPDLSLAQLKSSYPWMSRKVF